jgi:polyisoprenoid-binding protein YceI
MKKPTSIKNSISKYVSYICGAAVVLLAAFPGIILAQDTYKISASGDPDIKVLGTSNLHNWSMEAKMLSCSAKFNFPGGNNSLPQSLTSLNLTIPVQNLKSGESSMDSRAYSALKSDKYAAITYVLTAGSIVPAAKNQFQVKSTGNMSIAGVTRVVALDVNCLVNPDGSITCKGTQLLKMTDYQIKPPVFMLGALKTGDELTIDFTLVFKK